MEPIRTISSHKQDQYLNDYQHELAEMTVCTQGCTALTVILEPLLASLYLSGKLGPGYSEEEPTLVLMFAFTASDFQAKVKNEADVNGTLHRPAALQPQRDGASVFYSVGPFSDLRHTDDNLS